MTEISVSRNFDIVEISAISPKFLSFLVKNVYFGSYKARSQFAQDEKDAEFHAGFSDLEISAI